MGKSVPLFDNRHLPLWCRMVRNKEEEKG